MIRSRWDVFTVPGSFLPTDDLLCYFSIQGMQFSVYAQESQLLEYYSLGLFIFYTGSFIPMGDFARLVDTLCEKLAISRSLDNV